MSQLIWNVTQVRHPKRKIVFEKENKMIEYNSLLRSYLY